MEELTIEEKAQRYDKAIKEASIAHKDEDRHLKATLERIFPELAENKDEKEIEDERIRKQLKAFIHSRASLITQSKHDSWIAWLEKQAFNTYNANKEYWRGYREGKQEILDKYAEFEKQGEQKPYGQRKECEGCQFNYGGVCKGYCALKRNEPKFKVGDKIKTSNEESLTITKIDEKGYWSEDLFICGFDEECIWDLVGKKLADKIEPKFKVGDIIINKENGAISKVNKILSYDYELISFETGKNSILDQTLININNKLWTLADAKVGDVLVCKGDIKNSNGIKYEKICLFNNLGNAFFTLTKTSNYVEEYDIDVNIDYPDNTALATKGQKEILFMAMADAGYAFDFEKKELKKIEPKFKVGDWITNGEFIVGQIISIGKEYYHYICNGIEQPLYIPNAHKYHLWTIQDAKDGDVLINWNNTIFIFKDIEDESVKFHIAYNEKWDAIKTPSTKSSHMGLPEPQFEFHPATKEQRDLLFTKMKEAGYEWDNAKKELKKIEQKSAEWTHKDGKNLAELWEILSVHRNTNPQVDNLMEWVKDLVSYKRQEWSEEDEKQARQIERIVHNDGCTQKLQKQIADWLKSLKDRVQPNQEWSEEDKTMKIHTLEIIKKYWNSIPDTDYDENEISESCYNWLKSLRPQNNITDEELTQAKKDAYNDALDKIEYHSGEPTFDDGWSAAIWYLKKRNTYIV